MVDFSHEERLTLLERAQLLHDTTLRRHGDILDRHEERMAALATLQEHQVALMTELKEINARMVTTQAAILDLLRRGQNGPAA